MASSSRRAVITGLGVISPIGLDKAAYWEALCTSRSGVRPITSFDPAALPCRIGGQIVGFGAKEDVDKKERQSLQGMSRSIQVAVVAAQLAMDDCGVGKSPRGSAPV